MTRERFCKVCRDWHNPDSWPYECMPERSYKRSDLSSPMIALDTMDAVQSQLDGKMYDSKAALRATYKQAGVVEVGNDSSVLEPKPFKKPKSDRKAIRETVGKALNRAGISA
jgi:hypothetical protein